MSQSESAGYSDERRIYTVGEFAQGMSAWFARVPRLQSIAIAGEVSEKRAFGNGHVGFRLKEGQAVLECVMFADKRRTAQLFDNGTSVIATGDVRVRADRSGFQLHVESIELTGIGALAAQVEALREKFMREGLFADARKRAVPLLPMRVALVSARGMGAEDFEHVLRTRAPHVEIVFVETRVQGQFAEVDIAGAIDDASRERVDVIALVRGGGSYEDLFPFNLEPVVRAIVRSNRPVITAIGHKGHHHLADDVADGTYPTPSLAAEAIASRWEDARRTVRDAQRRLERSAEQTIVRAAQRAASKEDALRLAAAHLISNRVERVYARSRRIESLNPHQQLAKRAERFAAVRARLDAWPSQARFERVLERTAARLAALDPSAPLERGYAIVTKGGHAVSDAAQVAPGDVLRARVRRGTLDARVEGVHLDE